MLWSANVSLGVAVLHDLTEIERVEKTRRDFIAKVKPAFEKYKSIGVRIEDDMLVTATGVFFGKQYYAQNYGVVFTAYGAGAILGTLLSGSIKDITGSYLHAFPVVAGLALLGMVIAAMGLNPPDKRTF